jgi:hypothetical protein
MSLNVACPMSKNNHRKKTADQSLGGNPSKIAKRIPGNARGLPLFCVTSHNND